MNSQIDCRGLLCPAPVLKVRSVVTDYAPVMLTVTVDNEAARQNVYRFLEHAGYVVTDTQQGNDFVICGSKDGEVASVPAEIRVPDSSVKKRIMILVTSARMGHGDDSLGDMLMFNYLKTLKEMGTELWQVSFVNSGVAFCAADSEAVPILRELSSSGVRISACGACLAFFHVLDKLQVGEVTNMLEIVQAMQLADSVITV